MTSSPSFPKRIWRASVFRAEEIEQKIGYRFRDDKYAFLRKCSISALNLNFNTTDLARWSTIEMERGLDYPFARSYTMTLSIIFK